ncbi:phosphoribosylpyrophosphate synthetase [Hokovirus HKV1]|uniref:ribose-phosphate diphosphokinase n=1 Tax=Hokovirus HKV1 TaxID=1977638 RepID=A0A1V0SHF7_9VIRU|nr:phosphoribosylpyrophosphate synthetase [Hokovirus HKV1]
MQELFESKKSKIVLIAGSSNINLVKQIAINLNIELSDVKIRKFNNSEIDVNILNNIRGKRVFIVQTGSTIGNNSVNDMFMELLLLVNACKLSSAKDIVAIIPNFPYARSDKKAVPRTCIGASMVCNILKQTGVNRIVSMDLHSGQIQGFTDIPFDNLYAINILTNYLKNVIMNNDNDNNNYVLVAPDQGACKRIISYSKILNIPYVSVHKERNVNQISVIDKTIIMGDTSLLSDCTAIIVDDIVDTMGTMVCVVNDIKNYGVKDVIIVATHGIFSGQAINHINNNNIIRNVIVTNTIQQEENINLSNKIIQVDISHLLSNVIKCIITGESIHSLFS